MLQYGQCPDKGAAERSSAGLFEHVARLNGPLPDYHPQMILQCLLWGRQHLMNCVTSPYIYIYKRQGRTCKRNNREPRPRLEEGRGSAW